MMRGKPAPVAPPSPPPGDAEDATAGAPAIIRGAARMLGQHGFATLAEFRVGRGRRVDLVGLDRWGDFVIVEVKSSLADFRADRKWQDYLPWCDRFFFAVGADFPVDRLPAEQGVMVADGWGAAVLREAPVMPVNPVRRRSQILRFALVAGRRLHDVADPCPG